MHKHREENAAELPLPATYDSPRDGTEHHSSGDFHHSSLRIHNCPSSPAGGDGTKILVDCGLLQGAQFGEEANRKPFAYDPKTIDVLLVTHAHADHIGRIPRLVREGFNGVIYSTPATKELSIIMFDDSLKLLTAEAKKAGILPLYEKKDIDKALSL